MTIEQKEEIEGGSSEVEKKPPSRRDFLKIAGLVGAGIILPAYIKSRATAAEWAEEEMTARVLDEEEWLRNHWESRRSQPGWMDGGIAGGRWATPFGPRPGPTAPPASPVPPAATPESSPTAPTVPAGRPGQGVNPGWVGPEAGWADLSKSIGAGWVRVELNFNLVNNDWNSAKNYYQSVFRTARDRGLNVLGLVDYMTLPGTQEDWNRNSVEWESGDGTNEWVKKFVELFGLIATNFPEVNAWQIWNEANGWTTKQSNGRPWGSSYLDYSIYANMLRGAYDKLGSSGVPLVSGGIFTHNADRGTTYLHNVHNVGLSTAGWSQGLPYDHWSQHLYLNPGGLTSSYDVAAWLNGTRYALNSHGAGKGLWITEVGWQSADLEVAAPGKGRENQAENLRRVYKYLYDQRNNSYWNYGPAFWYRLSDYPGVTYGLVDGEGWKPAGYAFSETARFE